MSKIIATSCNIFMNSDVLSSSFSFKCAVGCRSLSRLHVCRILYFAVHLVFVWRYEMRWQSFSEHSSKCMITNDEHGIIWAIKSDEYKFCSTIFRNVSQKINIASNLLPYAFSLMVDPCQVPANFYRIKICY